MSKLPRNQTPEHFIQQLGEIFCASLPDAAQNPERQAVIGFGEYLLAARTARNLSRRDFAGLLGTTEARIHALEQGLLPRREISDGLLQHIATVLEDEREILSIILGDVTGRPPTPPVAAALPWRSVAVEPYRLRRLGRSLRKQQGFHWRVNRLFLAAIACTTLLYDRYRNLLDRLQPSRLVEKYGPKSMALVAVACCCIVLWMGSRVDHPFQSTVHVVPTAMVQPAAVSPLPRSPDNQSSGPSVSVARSIQPDATVVNDTYRIIYMNPSAHRQFHTVAYIAVNEQQLALIQFRNHPVDRWRCISSGRFDLCPI